MRKTKMNYLLGKMTYFSALFLLSAVAATETPKSSSTPQPQTTVSHSTVQNSTVPSASTTTHFVLLQQQPVRKSARNFQPSPSSSSASTLSDATSSTYPYDIPKKKMSYAPPDYSLNSNLYNGNHAFVYNTYTDKGKYSHYAPPAVTSAETIGKQAKQSAKYSSTTGSLPTTVKIERSHDDRDGSMMDYFSQNTGSGIREMPIMASNSRHGYSNYEDHSDYGTIAEDDYSPDIFSHHHHGHHHHHPVHHYPPPPTIYYPAHHHHDKHEYSKLGLLAVAKIVLAKVKALGLFKIILLLIAKIPLIFLKIALKFFFLFKAVKLFKILTISALAPLLLIPLLLLPLLLIPLAPLLLLPLLAIPLLLPLLLLLPLPVLTPPNNRSVEKKTTSTRRRREAASEHVDPRTGKPWRKIDSSPDFLMLTRQVLESQQCLERLSCKMAAKHDSATYTNVVLWLLEKMRALAPSKIRDRLASYTEAYNTGAKKPKLCAEKYTCDKLKYLMAEVDTYYNFFR